MVCKTALDFGAGVCLELGGPTKAPTLWVLVVGEAPRGHILGLLVLCCRRGVGSALPGDCFSGPFSNQGFGDCRGH